MPTGTSFIVGSGVIYLMVSLQLRNAHVSTAVIEPVVFSKPPFRLATLLPMGIIPGNCQVPKTARPNQTLVLDFHLGHRK
jgi:hypothetical protein